MVGRVQSNSFDDALWLGPWLGPDFWAQWYRLDDNQYTENKFRDELAKLQLQHELEPEGAPKITVDGHVKCEIHCEIHM